MEKEIKITLPRKYGKMLKDLKAFIKLATWEGLGL